MLNYVTNTNRENLSEAAVHDVLNDVCFDVRGASQCLYALSEQNDETEQLKMLADVLAFAADALGEVLTALEPAPVERVGRES